MLVGVWLSVFSMLPQSKAHYLAYDLAAADELGKYSAYMLKPKQPGIRVTYLLPHMVHIPTPALRALRESTCAFVGLIAGCKLISQDLN